MDAHPEHHNMNMCKASFSVNEEICLICKASSSSSAHEVGGWAVISSSRYLRRHSRDHLAFA